MLSCLKCTTVSPRLAIGISSKKLESWLDKQDEDLNELREELKKERKQHENNLRVTSSSELYFTVYLTLFCSPIALLLTGHFYSFSLFLNMRLETDPGFCKGKGRLGYLGASPPNLNSFYRAMHVVLARCCYHKSSICPSVRPSVTLMYRLMYRGRMC